MEARQRQGARAGLVMGGLKAPTHEVAHDKARELGWIV